MGHRLGRVLVLGSKGMVGSAVVRRLSSQKLANEVIPSCRDSVDLMLQADTFRYIDDVKPDWVVLAAAKVGGIYANETFPKDFIYNNLVIQLNAIEGSFRAGVKKLVALGSSCIYPKMAEQPIVEESLLTGSLERTNEPYAVAKIAGIKLCESYNRQYGTDYRSLMPTNLYGISDNYHSRNSHVIPALIRRFHEAKMSGVSSVMVWGSGSAKREFLWADDLADAVTYIMSLGSSEIGKVTRPMCSHLNVGTGKEISIKELAYLIAEVTGFAGEIKFDTSKPDGTPLKLMRPNRLEILGWRAKTNLREGLEVAYSDFQARWNEDPSAFVDS